LKRWPILVGLAPVGLALAWALAYPTAPMLVVGSPTAFDCGTVPRGTYRRQGWEVRNAARAPLRLRTWFTSGRSGFSLWQGQEHVIPPGRSLVVHLTWATPTEPGVPFSRYATLRTNDPDRPEVRLRVVGISGPALEMSPQTAGRR